MPQFARPFGMQPGMQADSVAVIGGGPAGLMAAEVLSAAGVTVDLFDAMPSVGRKFLLAGRGGLNLTHAEPLEPFMARYGSREAQVGAMVRAFDPQALRDWAAALGIETFVGTSQRVFPSSMKAAPMLRAWLHRLRSQGVRFHMRHRWVGWRETTPGVGAGWLFTSPAGEHLWHGRAVVLALGGASWPRLGSDGAWAAPLSAHGIDVAPLQAANCGFDVAPTAPGRAGWSPLLRERHAGQPVKPVVLSLTDVHGQSHRQQGEFVLTDTGIEGSLVYAHSAPIRELIAAHGQATVFLDLLPDHTPAHVLAEVTRPRGPRSLSTHLKSRLGISGLKAALLHEVLSPDQWRDEAALAHTLKALALTLVRPRPLAEAISTAGGVRFESLDEHLMARALPGVFMAGEMLDWEAPTGGYLLTATLASGRWAAHGVINWLKTSAS